jgi:CubicO group peptidase (beta-lactamase class C family)
LKKSATTGFIVIKDDQIIFEEYYNGNTEDSRCILFSATKAFVSALAGCAVTDGYIRSVDDLVTAYVPSLAGSGYDGVSIAHLLRMESGADFHEKDYMEMVDLLSSGMTHEEFLQSLGSLYVPGTAYRYLSADTIALGIVIREATGKSLAEYLEEKIWKKIGTEAQAFFSTDVAGVEAGDIGLNPTLRDFARFGRLYLNKGMWEGEEVLPADWVAISTTVGADAAVNEAPLDSRDWWTDSLERYWYRWFIPQDGRGDYLATGSWQNHLYIDPASNIIIAKTSAYDDWDGELAMDEESLSAFRAIADHFRD